VREPHDVKPPESCASGRKRGGASGVILAGGDDSGLMPESKELIAGVTNPIDLQVFVTPT